MPRAIFDARAQGTASFGSRTSRAITIDGRPMLIELGNEPPLSVDGGTSGFVDRRRVSVQWFSGTILTALCGAALWAAPFSRRSTAKPISRRCRSASKSRCAARSASAPTRSARSARADRLPTAEEPNVARQVIRVSTTMRAGNHEVVRVRPFVRIAGNLSLTDVRSHRRHPAVQSAAHARRLRRRRRRRRRCGRA